MGIKEYTLNEQWKIYENKSHFKECRSIGNDKILLEILKYTQDYYK